MTTVFVPLEPLRRVRGTFCPPEGCFVPQETLTADEGNETALQTLPYPAAVAVLRPGRRVRRGDRLPAVVGEGLVGLRHAEDVVLPLVRAALLLLGVEQLVGQPLRHRALAAAAGEADEPAHGERAGAAGGHLDRHLVGRAADAAGAGPEHPRGGPYRRFWGPHPGPSPALRG